MELQVKNLRARLLGEPVLEIPDLRFSGDSLCVLGERHSGKTPFALALSGVYGKNKGEECRGETLFSGICLSSLSERERNVGILFPARTLFPGTGYDNAAYGLRLRGVEEDKIASLVKEGAEKLGVSALLTKPANKLTDAEAREISFLRLFVRRPLILFVDEPFYYSDTQAVNVLRRWKKAAREEGIFFVLLTKNADQGALFDGVLILKGGKMLSVGARSALTRDVADIYAARLLYPEYSELSAVVSGGKLSVAGQTLGKTDRPDGNYTLFLGEDAVVLSGAEDPLCLVDYSEETETAGVFRLYLDLDKDGERAGENSKFTLLSDRKPEKSTVNVRMLPEKAHLFAEKD